MNVDQPAGRDYAGPVFSQDETGALVVDERLADAITAEAVTEDTAEADQDDNDDESNDGDSTVEESYARI